MDINSAVVNRNSGEESGGHVKVFKILVIGETGSGKSTFINYITNYFLNGSLDNLKIAIPTRFLSATENFSHSETNPSDPTRSQTDVCTTYDFIDHHTSNCYLFVDTPGLSSTRGIQKDDENMKNIVDAVDKMGGLSAIVIVINGCAARFTGEMKRIFMHLRCHFELRNVINIVILSNAHWHTCGFDVRVLDSIMDKFDPFYIQMSAFCINPNVLDERAREHIQDDWTNSMEEIRKIIQLINNLAPHF